MLIVTADRILTPEGWLEDAAVLCDGGRVVRIAPQDELPDVPDAVRVGGSGVVAVPGFIDTHVHGAAGSDFMDATPEAVAAIAEFHITGGTTSWTPTTVCDSREKILSAVHVASDVGASCGIDFLGCHLEGPYFNPLRHGCHDVNFVRPSDLAEIDAFLEFPCAVARMTLAPEMPGAVKAIEKLAAAGVTVSAGHSMARYSEVMAAADAGLSVATHVFLAMSSIVKNPPHREGGLLEATLLDDRIAAELINDGVHLPPELMKLARKTKGADGLFFTTDCMRGAGMPDGHYTFGGQHGTKANVTEGIAITLDGSGFASGTARMIDLVRVGVEQMDLTLAESVHHASGAVAQAHGVGDRKGRLAEGADADIVLIAEDFQVRKTITGGEVVYESD